MKVKTLSLAILLFSGLTMTTFAQANMCQYCNMKVIKVFAPNIHSDEIWFQTTCVQDPNFAKGITYSISKAQINNDENYKYLKALILTALTNGNILGIRAFGQNTQTLYNDSYTIVYVESIFANAN